MMENKFYDTKLKDVHGHKINIGSSIRINKWDYGKLVIEDGKYYVKINGELLLVTPDFIKDHYLEVTKWLK